MSRVRFRFERNYIITHDTEASFATVRCSPAKLPRTRLAREKRCGSDEVSSESCTCAIRVALNPVAASSRAHLLDRHRSVHLWVCDRLSNSSRLASSVLDSIILFTSSCAQRVQQPQERGLGIRLVAPGMCTAFSRCAMCACMRASRATSPTSGGPCPVEMWKRLRKHSPFLFGAVCVRVPR